MSLFRKLDRDVRVPFTRDLWINLPALICMGAYLLMMTGVVHSMFRPKRLRPFYLSDFAPTKNYLVAPKGGWALSWDGMMRCPRWTLERLRLEDVGNAERPPAFHVDPADEPEFPVSPDDWNGFTTIYDRGHSACNKNHTATEEQALETFTIHNAFPQAKWLNEQLWRHLEDHCRPTAAGVNVWILTVTIWAPVKYPKSWEDRDATYTIKSIGSNHVWVPTHCWKSILIEHGAGPGKRGDPIEIHSWLVPNDDSIVEGHTFDEYAVPTDLGEKLAGLNAWHAVPKKKQDELEAAKCMPSF